MRGDSNDDTLEQKLQSIEKARIIKQEALKI